MSPFKISSPAFSDGGAFPSIFTRCDGEDRSPPLEWSNVPPGTKSLALIVDDPDAPDPKAPKMTWVHWVLYNIKPSVASGLVEGGKPLPDGAVEGLNDWKTRGYGGPSPPRGRHRYFFKLYALDTMLPDDLSSTGTKQRVLDAMEGHVLGKAELIGTYKKGGGAGR